MKPCWSQKLPTTPFLLVRTGLVCYFFLVIYARRVVGAFTSEPRWGQAVSVVNNLLYVSGGKTDQYGSYSYTSAPTTNDLFTLDLSKGFDPASPPWNYICGLQESSTTQGQELAWHTLSTYNTSQLLLFGGDGGPNSPIVLPSQANSAQILDVSSSRGDPTWIGLPEGWAGEPSRRIHHTTTSIGGKVYLVGGEKDDGSSAGYSDHYVFDPSTPSFTRLPTENGPPDIYGHGSVVLSDGRLLVFGGYSQSEAGLIPFTTVWSLDIRQSNSNLAWTTENVSGDNVPNGRRAFAYTWIEGDRVLIHGGSDAQFQTSYSDGWILDTTTNPMTWTNVSALSQIGARRDHFAVQVGHQVLFGFGYGTNAGASVALSVFDYDQGTFTSSFSPQSGPSLTTLPSPSGTGGSSSGGSDGSGSGGSNGGSNPGDGSHGPGDPSNPNDPGSGGGNGDGDDKKNVAVITIASIFGVLAAALAAGFLIVVIIRRRRTRSRFHLLNNEDDRPPPRPSASPPWGLAGIAILPWFRTRRALARGEKTRVADKKEGWTVLGLGRPRERIDMLANEDASEHGIGVGYGRRPRHLGSGDSGSWFSAHDEGVDLERHGSGSSIGRLFSGSLTSLKNIGTGVRRVISGGSASGHGHNHGRQWTDISLTVDPFEDSEGLLLHDKSHASYEREGEEGDIALAARPRGGRQESSHASKYSDPFQDTEGEVLFDVSASPIGSKSMVASDPSSSGTGSGTGRRQNEQDVKPRSSQSTLSHSSIVPQLPPLVTTSTKSTTNDPSSSSLVDASASAAGHSSSSSSHQATLSVISSGRPRTTSIIGSAPPPTSQVKRSDSWWTRFRRPRASSLRENSIDQGRQQFARMDLDFRDPNPPPGRLGAIKEASGGSSVGAGDSLQSSRMGRAGPSHEKKKSGSGSGFGAVGRLYMASDGHEQSTTSLKTSRTADSAALERLAGRVDVAFREATGGSSVDYASSVAESHSVRRGSHEHEHEREGTWSTLDSGFGIGGAGGVGGYGHAMRRSDSPERSLDIADLDADGGAAMFGEGGRRSPFERTGGPSSARLVSHYHSLSTPIPVPPVFPNSGTTYKAKSPISPGTVAARVADYERRMSLEPTSPSPSSSTPTPTPVTSSSYPASPSPSPRTPTPRTPKSQGSLSLNAPTTTSGSGSGSGSSSTTPKHPGSRKVTNVKYGLVQRPELFIANPDRDRHSMSGSSDV